MTSEEYRDYIDTLTYLVLVSDGLLYSWSKADGYQHVIFPVNGVRLKKPRRPKANAPRTDLHPGARAES